MKARSKVIRPWSASACASKKYGNQALAFVVWPSPSNNRPNHLILPPRITGRQVTAFRFFLAEHTGPGAWPRRACSPRRFCKLCLITHLIRRNDGWCASRNCSPRVRQRLRATSINRRCIPVARSGNIADSTDPEPSWWIAVPVWQQAPIWP